MLWDMAEDCWTHHELLLVDGGGVAPELLRVLRLVLHGHKLLVQQLLLLLLHQHLMLLGRRTQQVLLLLLLLLLLQSVHPAAIVRLLPSCQVGRSCNSRNSCNNIPMLNSTPGIDDWT